jgi:hypothetical protein
MIRTIILLVVLAGTLVVAIYGERIGAAIAGVL